MSQPASPRRESAFFRRLAHLGALRGPRDFLRLAPGPIGAAFGAALPEVRRRVIRNLRRIHGRRTPLREHLDALETLSNYAACFAEAIASGREDVKPRLTVHGEPRLQAALARGGVVIVTAHIGPWELTAQQLGRTLSAEVMIVMQREPNEAAGKLQDEHRSARGLNVLHVGDNPFDALPLIAHLKRGGVAALQLDRVPPNGRILGAPLFGKPFHAPEGPFRLASLSGASVVPVFARRLDFFDYELQIDEPIELSRRPSPAELERAAARALRSMESWLSRYPTQWFHFSK
ncbi:MAG TPA: lysophospholipid acyltransferase family protein [Polyangiaceae bacterium]|nr:lysophospholipid acyltransferase family protein [Polyangiaceae bacterium]